MWGCVSMASSGIGMGKREISPWVREKLSGLKDELSGYCSAEGCGEVALELLGSVEKYLASGVFFRSFCIDNQGKGELTSLVQKVESCVCDLQSEGKLKGSNLCWVHAACRVFRARVDQGRIDSMCFLGAVSALHAIDAPPGYFPFGFSDVSRSESSSAGVAGGAHDLCCRALKELLDRSFGEAGDASSLRKVSGLGEIAPWVRKKLDKFKAELLACWLEGGNESEDNEELFKSIRGCLEQGLPFCSIELDEQRKGDLVPLVRKVKDCIDNLDYQDDRTKRAVAKTSAICKVVERKIDQGSIDSICELSLTNATCTIRNAKLGGRGLLRNREEILDAGGQLSAACLTYVPRNTEGNKYDSCLTALDELCELIVSIIYCSDDLF